MKGTLIYQGTRVVFTDEIIFQNKRQFLIAYDGQAIWVKEEDVIQVVYSISERKSA